jgi:glycosyltransferase involved in cell wall biosynthesis
MSASGMRICLFTPTFFPKVGGAEMCVDQLARNFAGAGHKVVVVAQSSRGPGESLQGDYPVVRYRRPLSQSGSYFGVKRLLAMLQRTHGFNVFNAHMAYPGGYVGTWFSRRFQVPLVITPQGGDVFYRSRFRSRPLIWARISTGLSAADAVTAPSCYFERLIAEIAPSQTHVVRIPNGVDAGIFSTEVELAPEYRRDCGEQFILGLGRLVPRKGFDTAIRAFAQVHKCHPDLKLVLAGDGTQRRELEALAHQLGLADRVVFLGTVVGPQKIAILQQCLFTIAPSVDEDNMPLVVPEALACGKPVIASRLGGIPDVIVPGQNGLLCAAGDVGDFARAISQLLQSGGYRDMSAAARRTADELDWKQIADGYLSVYERVLAARRNEAAA